jgi:CheY-like chemotaxis protein
MEPEGSVPRVGLQLGIGRGGDAVRVLIVDDESRYRVYLSAKLGSLGHEVAVADTGRQAIERGLFFRPNVLVSDWMLRNHVHGLHVIDALRAVDSGLPAILMTGFPSRDLRSQARSSRVVDFLEKPFELADLVAAVERAGVIRRPVLPHVDFGVVTTRGEFCLVASERARIMLDSTEAGRSARRMDALFDRATIEALSGGEPWVLVAPRAQGRVRWWAHWSRKGEHGVLAILPHRKAFLRNDRRLRMLLSMPPLSGVDAPFGRILVVDATPIPEVRYPQQLERIGWTCLKAETPELALRLLGEDPSLALVVVDRAVGGAELAGLVARIRELRPRAEIVGASRNLSDERDFAALGVRRFLQVPWRVGDLLDLLGG